VTNDAQEQAHGPVAKLLRAASQCRACRHEKNSEIDRAIANGETYSSLAKRFNLSMTGLKRHRGHIPPSVMPALTAMPSAEIVHALTVLEHVHHLLGEARRLKELAEKRGDIRTAMYGLRELVRIVELFARITGELEPSRNETNILNVHVTPEAAAKIAETYLARRREPAQLPEPIDVNASA